jgi:GNAT superfamily N-acetyltransferase
MKDGSFRPGCTGEEAARLADEHTLAVQAWLASRSPGAATWQGRGVTLASTGLPVPLLNLALGFDFPPGTPDSVVEGEIEKVKGFFTRRGVPWYWWIGPHPHPPRVTAHLARHGVELRSPLPAMVAPLPAPPVAIDPAIRVWQAATRADLAAASTIRRLAFRFPPDTAAHYFEEMAADWLGNDQVRLYLARLEGGPPASMVAHIMAAGLPGVYVMATLPEFQRRGLGRAVLARLMADAAQEGHRMIVLTASRFGYPLYRQFGFEHVFDYRIYRLASAHRRST